MTEVSRSTAPDVSLIGTVAVVLTAIHFLVPDGIQAQLAFDHARFAPWTLLTSAYLHNSDLHLLGNLFGYVIGAGIAYVLCINQDRRRWFWTTTAAFLVLLPVLVSLTSYATFQSLGIEGTSRGFSGVVAGYVGFILVVLCRWLADAYDWELAINVGTGVFLILLGEVTIIYGGTLSVTIGALLMIGFGVTFGSVARRGLHSELTEDERRAVAVEAGLTASVVALLVLFVWVLFPASITEGGSTTNIIAHATGVVGGILISSCFNILYESYWKGNRIPMLDTRLIKLNILRERHDRIKIEHNERVREVVELLLGIINLWISLTISLFVVVIGLRVQPFNELAYLVKATGPDTIIKISLIFATILQVAQIIWYPWTIELVRDVMIKVYTIFGLGIFLLSPFLIVLFRLPKLFPDTEFYSLESGGFIFIGLYLLALVTTYLLRLIPWVRAVRIYIQSTLKQWILPPFDDTGWHLNSPLEKDESVSAVRYTPVDYRDLEPRNLDRAIKGWLVSSILTLILFTLIAMLLDGNFPAPITPYFPMEDFPNVSPETIGDYLTMLAELIIPGEFLQALIDYFGLNGQDIVAILLVFLLPIGLLSIACYNFAYLYEHLQYMYLHELNSWLDEGLAPADELYGINIIHLIIAMHGMVSVAASVLLNHFTFVIYLIIWVLPLVVLNWKFEWLQEREILNVHKRLYLFMLAIMLYPLLGGTLLTVLTT